MQHLSRGSRRPERSGQRRRHELPPIANRPDATAERLAGRIIVPHPAMPGVQLTVRELRDIIAYILSLKRAK